MTGALSLALACAALAAGPAPLPGVSLLLPEGSGIAVRVVVAPAGSDAAARLGWENVRFALGPGEAVWFAHDGSEAANFTQGYRLRLERGFDDVAGAGVALLFASSGDLGYAVAGASAGLGAFQPVAALPVDGARLFAGDAGVLYVAGRGRRGPRPWELWALGGRPPDPATGLPAWRKLLSSTERVTAAAGDGRETFVALGKLVGRLEGATVKGVFLHPREDVSGLAYSRESGLFYATAGGGGAIGESGSVEFLRAPRPQLLARGGSVFVFLPRALALLRLDGAEKLRSYSR
ncbi:MAG: hypothetical protein HY553_14085 [Elusimicrobia bacterium]|nr:hypothetical protein [Elusimicrobiota bacterium]